MATVSLCMIVKNEEAVLVRCLDSVKGAVDEIIVVDTGSTDRTREIAARYTDKAYNFTWIDDFSAARNFAFSKATMEYCLWLDADDVLLEPDRAAFLDLKRTLPADTDVVMMPYHTAFDAAGHPTFSYDRERLIRNLHRDLWQGAVHEVIPPFGKVAWSQAAITHKKEGPGDPDRNLRIFEDRIARGLPLQPREQFYYARELYYHRRYADGAARFRAFLDGGEGWVENNIEACRFLAYCLYGLGARGEALRALLRSLEYDDPRAETCCDLGGHFLDQGECRRAAFWYELALTRPRDDHSGAFVQPDCYGYLPCIQLCVCYDRLGDRARAEDWNRRAGAYKPEDPAYRHNLDYFAGLTP